MEENVMLIPRGNGRSTLVNMGNTCFMNTALQVVLHTMPLTKYFHMPDITGDRTAEKESLAVDFVDQYRRLARGFWEENCRVQPVSFYKTFGNCIARFRDGRQHDSLECLLHLLDFLHMGLSKPIHNVTMDEERDDPPHKTWLNFLKLNERSVIIDLFYGMSRTAIQCLVCKNVSKKYDPFSFLSLCFPPRNSPVMKKGVISLEDMLKFHSLAEKMEGDNRYACSKCKEEYNKTEHDKPFPNCDANKMIQLWMLPPILIIDFKRYDHRNMKINTLVKCPLTMDFSPFIPSQVTTDPVDYTYELYAVIYHTGHMRGGHYVAACKVPATTLDESGGGEEWVQFDDSRLMPITENQVVNSMVYGAVYRRKTPSRNVEKLWW
jgi:ubiquitin carboxyl-terminal hydrolase 8